MCKETSKTCTSEQKYVNNCQNTNDYLIIVVLYILLVIILAACLF